MGDGDQSHKPGRRQPRFRAPSSRSIKTKRPDWPGIEKACGLKFSDEARRRITWAHGNYRMMNEWPSLTRSQFLDAAAAKVRAISRFRKDFGDHSGAFGSAIRTALTGPAATGPAATGPAAGVEWDDAGKALTDALDRVEGLLRHAPDAPKEAERWGRAMAWDRYVAAIIEAFENDGHPVTVGHAPVTPLVTLLRRMGAQGQNTELSSFVRHIQRAAKAAQSSHPTKLPSERR